MKTVEVSTSYKVRRRQLSKELENAEKEVRGFLTRSILNIDLSAKTYEVFINSLVRMRELDRFEILDTEKKVHEARKWVTDYNDSINRIDNKNNRKNLKQSIQNLENLLEQKGEYTLFLEQFYLNYFDIILSISEDALIQIYISEDYSNIYDRTISMLDNLALLHPLGGLTTIIKSISDMYKLRYNTYNIQDMYRSYIDLFSDTTIIWSQVVQLIIDFIAALERGGNVTVENSNANLDSRMKGLIDLYQGKANQ